MPTLSALPVSHTHRVGVSRLWQPTGPSQPAASALYRCPALQRTAGTLHSIHRVTPLGRSLPHPTARPLPARTQADICLGLPRCSHSLGRGTQLFPKLLSETQKDPRHQSEEKKSIGCRYNSRLTFYTVSERQ